MSSPTVSITVLSYNYGRYLAECLDSVFAQSFTDFELIIIDDGSSDETYEVAGRYADDPRVQLVRHEPNEGFTSSLIEGTEERSHGRLRMHLSADDRIVDPDALARQVRAFEENPTLAMCFSGYERFGDGAGRTSPVTPIANDVVFDSHDAFRVLLGSRIVHPPHSGTMFTAEAYAAAGGYRRDVRYALDSVLWPMLALQGPVAYVAVPLYGYRVHQGQMSQSVAVGRAHLDELIRGIDLASELALADEYDQAWRSEVDTLSHDARDFKVGAVAMDHAFAGRYRSALKCWWAAMTYAPMLGLRSRTLQSALLRIFLGERMTNWLLRRVGRGKKSSPVCGTTQALPEVALPGRRTG